MSLRDALTISIEDVDLSYRWGEQGLGVLLSQLGTLPATTRHQLVINFAMDDNMVEKARAVIADWYDRTTEENLKRGLADGILTQKDFEKEIKEAQHKREVLLSKDNVIKERVGNVAEILKGRVDILNTRNEIKGCPAEDEIKAILDPALLAGKILIIEGKPADLACLISDPMYKDLNNRLENVQIDTVYVVSTDRPRNTLTKYLAGKAKSRLTGLTHRLNKLTH